MKRPSKLVRMVHSVQLTLFRSAKYNRDLTLVPRRTHLKFFTIVCHKQQTFSRRLWLWHFKKLIDTNALDVLMIAIEEYKCQSFFQVLNQFSLKFLCSKKKEKKNIFRMSTATGATTSAPIKLTSSLSAMVRRKKSRRRSNINLHVPTSMHDVRSNRFIRALAQTTMDLCRDSSLHGIKHIMTDIQELSSSYSR